MKALRISLYLLAAALLLVLALAGALWLWSGGGTSLAISLAQLARYLPAGQTLEVKDVKGSLRGGGSIGWLRWQQGEISVEVRDVTLAWSLRPLLDGELRLGRVAARHLRIDDRRPASEPSAATPPTDLRLALRVDAPFTVDRVEWAGTTSLQATDVAGHYVFDSYSHKLDQGQAHISSGKYLVSGSLQAQSPMALSVQVNGTVQTTLPSSQQPVTVQAHATVTGPLAGRDAALALQAELVPVRKTTPTGSQQAMQASLSARIQPWQPQPVARLKARWQALDLAALWPQAPQTRLDGAATVTPAGPGWQAGLQLSNTLSGTWDKQRLPLERLDAKVEFVAGQWTLQSLQAAGAGGRIEAKGQLTTAPASAANTPNPAHWQGSATVHGINAMALDSRLAAATLDGHVTSSRGQGELSLRVTEAALASRWVARLPGLPPASRQASIQGAAEITGRWQQQGQALQIQARLRAPRLDLRQAGQTAEQGWRLRDWQVDLTGTPRALSLSTRGRIETGTQRLTLQAQAHGGRLNEGVWRAQLDTAQLTMQDRLKPGNWTVQLSDSVSFNWKQSGTRRTLEASAGAARLTGPVSGSATVSWQPAHWSQQMTGTTARTEWRSQGRIADLPLAWLDLLGPTPMANLGLRGDLLFGGQWDATSGETLRLRATLERTRGDLLLQTDAAATLRAGVREARLVMTAEGERLAASLRWDSERAGQAQADFSTRLQRQGGTWSWPNEAALAGTLKVQLPPVDAWSLLAPPGWRLRGTLDADAVLSGTRGAPQWRGNLAAQNLAVRSVVDGIDFSNGTLRASLEGQRLDINEFTLQGAGGAGGGQLRVTGSVLWLPAAGSDANAVSRLRMELGATAQALRVSARADRRLVLSGKLSARLREASLAIRGTLQADSALFILPQDTAPRLGDDVVVRTLDGKAPSGRTATPLPASVGVRVTPDVAVTLDLGQDFQVRGRGLATRLAGRLELRSAGRDRVPSLTGALRTVRGTYKAYGQQLDIEEGVLHFLGPYDNPALDILAIRPNLQQRVGVQISGTALSPLVRLYAEPDLPEAEKLAWLVLGRSGASGGAESAVLQQAALALLGGNGRGLSSGLADALRLDELSVRGGASNTGTTTGASITLGKRVLRDFYVAYERSLAGTMGTFYIFYDLARRFTLRAQTGEQSAVDLIFTLRYD